MVKNMLRIFAIVAICVGLLAGSATAREHTIRQRDEPEAGKAMMELVHKDPTDWSVVDGGGKGELKYKLWGRKLSVKFRGVSLEPGQRYTLIYFPDPWPGHGLICLGKGVANDAGNVLIKNRVENIPELPLASDANYPCGAKIWLVLTSDVDCQNQVMTGWHPAEYLFQVGLIRFSTDAPGGVEGPAN